MAINCKNNPISTNIYLFRVNYRNTRKRYEYVQNQ